MIDKYGNLLEKGNTIITTVSKNSHYLTTGIILDISEESEKILVMYSSTPSAKWRLANECVKIETKPNPLVGDLGLCRDCTGRPIKIGDKVIYRTTGDGGFNIDGEITSIESDLWATVNNNIKLRNVSLYVL